MMFRKKKAPETTAEKFARLLDFDRDMVNRTRATIATMKAGGDVPLALANYSYMIQDYASIAAMLWRKGEDPRATIGQAQEVYTELLEYRAEIDPMRQIDMDTATESTDWDFVYSIFWLTGNAANPEFRFPHILSERYFSYARYILHRVTETEVPAEIDASVNRFQTEYDELVDRNFRDLLMVLGDKERDGSAEALEQRIQGNWLKRRKTAFFYTSAPVLAGHDASNDLYVDYQLGCVLKKKGLEFPENPHFWRWS